MAEMPKVFYPREGQLPKILTPSTPAELEKLLKIGWKRLDS